MATNLNLPVETRQIGGIFTQTINARHLHVRLDIGRDFSTWIKTRIEQYGFIEDEDFSPVLEKTQRGIFTGRPKTEYFLSLEMAKELALVENNAHGRAIRRGLIAMEKRMREELPAIMAAVHKELRLARPEWQSIERYVAMGLTHNEIAKLLGVTPTTVRDRLKRMAACRLVDYRPNAKLAEQGRKGMQVLQQKLALEGGNHG